MFNEKAHMFRFSSACACLILAGLAWGQERSKTTFSEVAERMVKAINAADYEGVRKDFSKEMLKAFPLEKCKAFFKDLSRDFGKIKKLEPPQLKPPEKAIFVARCERGALKFSLFLDENGLVNGMLFEPYSDLPVPQKNTTKLALPFNDTWLVFWGGDTAELNHHHESRAQRFAFDLVGVGADGKRTREPATETRIITHSAGSCSPPPTGSLPR
jgi:hypothetical protein